MNKKVIIPLIIFIGLAAYLLYLTQFKDSNDQPFSDFAVEDTTSISKIEIIRTTGEEISLIKKENNWYIEATDEPANEASIDLILKTLSQWKVLQDLETEKTDFIIKLLSSKHTKIKIFTNNENEAEKTIYLGDHNASMTGNYALLQKGNKKSSIPYLINLPGFYGTLETRFFANHNAWKSTKVIALSPSEISKITLKNYENPDDSYSISVDKDNFSLYSASGLQVPQFDTISLRRHLVSFKELYFESLVTHLSDNEKSKLLNSSPLFDLEVTDNKNNITSVKIFCKKPESEQRAPDGSILPCDSQRFYAYINQKELVIIQVFGWGPALKPLSYFTAQ